MKNKDHGQMTDDQQIYECRFLPAHRVGNSYHKRARGSASIKDHQRWLAVSGVVGHLAPRRGAQHTRPPLTEPQGPVTPRPALRTEVL